MSRTKKEGLGLQKIYIKIIQKLSSIKGSPVAIAKGFATGVAMSFTPFVGFHLVLCLGVSKITKQNNIASALGTLAGNPWTFPFIWYLVFHTGIFILGQDAPEQEVDFRLLFRELFHCVINLDFSRFWIDIWPVFYPMLIGCIPLYVIVWQVMYHMIKHVLKEEACGKEKDKIG